MRASIEAAAISALKELEVPFLHHERSGQLTIPIDLDSRGVTLIGVHCFEAEMEVWLVATIFTLPVEHQVAMLQRLLELNAELKWGHYCMLDGKVFFEEYLDLELVSDRGAYVLRHLLRLVATIDDTYNDLLTCAPSQKQSRTRVEREIEVLLNSHNDRMDA